MMTLDCLSIWGENEKDLCKGIGGFNIHISRVSGPRSFVNKLETKESFVFSLTGDRISP